MASNLLLLIGSGNGVLPNQHQAITWTNINVLLTGPQRTKFSEILFLYMLNCLERPKKIYSHFISFFHIVRKQVVEILPQVRHELPYSTLSISWMLMCCWHKEPGHQQPWYLLCWTKLICSPMLRVNQNTVTSFMKTYVITFLYTHSQPLSSGLSVLMQVCWSCEIYTLGTLILGANKANTGKWHLQLHFLECQGSILTHWDRDKMAAIFQTTVSNGFSWMKIYEFRLSFIEVCSQGSN